MQFIKQSESTSARREMILVMEGPNGAPGSTGIAGPLTVTKAGGSPAIAAGTLTELTAVSAPGVYRYLPTTSEINTLGIFCVALYDSSGTGMGVARAMIVPWDPYDSVRLGLTAMPNAAAGATSGLQAGIIRAATAQAGAASTITLDGSASATDDIYIGYRVRITSGTGAGQGNRLITDYVGSTKVATVGPDWATSPDNTSVFEIYPC